MFRLDIPREPRWVDLPLGVSFEMKPVSAAMMSTARMRAQRQLRDMVKTLEEAREAGIPCDMPDVTNSDIAAGHMFALLVVALGREVVTDWKGVADQAGAPVPFDVALLPKVLAHPDIA